MRWAPRGCDITEWHRWFAWFPVRIDDHTVVWLETIERIGHNGYCDIYWSYR